MADHAGTRRKFLKRTLLGGAGLALAGGVYTIGIEPIWILVTRHRIRIPGLAPELHGKRIVQLTDLHLGSTGASQVSRAVDKAAALRPDMFVLTGDFIGRRDESQAAGVAEILSRLHAPLGVYAVSGNHDFGVYRAGSRARDAVVMEMLEAKGIENLDNRAVPFGSGDARTWLVGLGDLWAGRSDIEGTLSPLPRADAKIVLSHNPDTIFDIAPHGVDLVLSGHTHGGQIDIPLVGPPILPVRHRQYYSGLYQVDARTRLFVSNGLGWLIRARFNARPEIAVFDISPSG